MAREACQTHDYGTVLYFYLMTCASASEKWKEKFTENDIKNNYVLYN